VSDGSVICFLRDAKRPLSNPAIICWTENSGFDDCDEAILLALAEQPFALIRD
jgi:hypothetical protein